MSKLSEVDAIAIDGPAGSGKSTIAREVARKLGFIYIDTGAMYRAVVLAAKRAEVDLEDEGAMEAIAKNTAISFDETGTKIFIGIENVSEEIRTPEVTNITRYAARVPGVRDILVKLQRDMAGARRVVMEGRDITTVVLPNARWRIFLTASCEVRARRRFDDFEQKGFSVDYQTLLSEIVARDDSDNSVGPMKEAQERARAGDGITLLDTSAMTQQEVVDEIESYVNSY